MSSDVQTKTNNSGRIKQSTMINEQGDLVPIREYLLSQQTVTEPLEDDQFDSQRDLDSFMSQLSIKYDNIIRRLGRDDKDEKKKTLKLKFKHQQVYEWQRRNERFVKNFKSPVSALGQIDISRTVQNKGEELVKTESVDLFSEFLKEKGVHDEYQSFIKDAQISNSLDSMKIFLQSEKILHKSY